KVLAAAAAATLGLTAGSAFAQDYPWKPERPITLIVPWAAGGSTDQMARIVATELEPELRQKVVVVNQPGASGSVGTKGVLEGAKDGYTWAAGAAVDIGGYKVLGLLDSQLKDWHLFFAGANVNTLAANPNAPFEGYGEIPPVTKWLPNMPAPLNYFGIWVPTGTPEPVAQTVEMVWKKKIANSEALKRYAAARAALFTPISGADAEKEAMKMVTQT